MFKRLLTKKLIKIITIVIIIFIGYSSKNVLANENDININNEITEAGSILENPEVNNKLNSLYSYINNVKSEIEILNDLDPV